MARKRSNPRSGTESDAGQVESVAGSTEEVATEVKRKRAKPVARQAEEDDEDFDDEIPAGVTPEMLAALMAKMDEKPKQPGLLVRWAPVLIALIVVAGWYVYNDSKPGPNPDRPDATSDLGKMAKEAFATSEDAQQFAGACRTMAEIIQADGEGKERPTLTKRGQVSDELIQEFARATLLSGVGADAKAVGDLILKAFEDFPDTEGALTSEDREKAKASFIRLAKAAEEI